MRDQFGDPMRKRLRFPRTGAGNDKKGAGTGAIRPGDPIIGGAALLGIERGKTMLERHRVQCGRLLPLKLIMIRSAAPYLPARGSSLMDYRNRIMRGDDKWNAPCADMK